MTPPYHYPPFRDDGPRKTNTQRSSSHKKTRSSTESGNESVSQSENSTYVNQNLLKQPLSKTRSIQSSDLSTKQSNSVVPSNERWLV